MSGSCPHCGERIEAGERFCTRCGTEALSEPAAAVAGPARRSSWPRGAKIALALVVLALVLASATAVALGLELSTTLDEKEQAEAWLAATERELDTTKRRLRDSESLSSRRKVVLQRTDRVLEQVDPLLSSVDRMRETTSRMTETQESFAVNAGLVISSLAALIDHVAGTSPLYWDLVYISSLLGDVRAGASAAGQDQDRFESLEREYASASREFEQRATRYVRAVELLEAQLQKVTRQ